MAVGVDLGLVIPACRRTGCPSAPLPSSRSRSTLPPCVFEILRVGTRRRQIQHAVAAERHARRARCASRRHEDVLGARQAPCASHDGPRDRDGVALRVELLGVVEIDVAVLRELRMKHDVHQAVHRARQPGLAGAVVRRHAGDRLRIELAVADDAQLPHPLGDEHGAVGQPRHAVRIRQTLGDDDDADPLPFAGVVDKRARRRAACSARPVGATGMPPANGTFCCPNPIATPALIASNTASGATYVVLTLNLREDGEYSRS